MFPIAHIVLYESKIKLTHQKDMNNNFQARIHQSLFSRYNEFAYSCHSTFLLGFLLYFIKVEATIE